MALKIHIEVFIAAQLLAQRQKTFTLDELNQVIVQNFGDMRIGVQTHISAHCVANVPRSAKTVYNYLWQLDRGLLRVFSPDVDIPHPSRLDAITRPDPDEIPGDYRAILATSSITSPAQTTRLIATGTPLLYLVRPALTNEQLQENLHILSVPAGTPLTIHYQQYLHISELQNDIRRNRAVCIVFSDPPYRQFIPIRHARIMDISQMAGETAITLILDTLVKNFVTPTSTDWRTDLETFSECFRTLYQEQTLVICNAALSVSFIAENQDDRAAWRRIIDALRITDTNILSRYTQTVFLRALHLTDDEGRVVPLGGALAVGKTYGQALDCYAPHLTNMDLSEHGIILSPSATHIPLPDVLPLVPNGELSLNIIPIEPGKIALELWVRPDRTHSTTLRLRYPVVESATIAGAAMDGEAARQVSSAMQITEKQTPAMAVSALTDWHLRAIFKVLQQPEAATRDRAQLSLVDYVLGPLVHNSHYLQEQRGLILTQLGHWEEAYLQFASLDPDRLSPHTIAVWFVSACRSGSDVDLGKILLHFNAWEQRELVQDLIAALPLIDEERRLRLLEEIWLGAGSYYEMWETVKATFTRPETILQVARIMMDPDAYNLLSAAEGYVYLCERMATLNLVTLPLLRQAVDWGLQDPDHAPDLDGAVLDLVQRLLQHTRDPLEAWILVNRARDLAPQAWVAAAEPLARVLARHPQVGWRAEACKLYIELARTQRERLQDLDAAKDYLSQAHLLVGDDPELDMLVHEENARLATVVERIEAVRSWWEEVQKARIQRLHERLQGQTEEGKNGE
ncbi:MAG: hypothetical protein JXA33_29265 [Anaerolineae bacterium]|nr:hypothetical protein [Anaerolineae bacterium]